MRTRSEASVEAMLPPDHAQSDEDRDEDADDLSGFGCTAPTPLDIDMALENERQTGRRTPGVLVLDDDAVMLGLQCRMLRSLGVHRVSTAASAGAALALLARQHPPIDLILCDLAMPGMDGIEFLSRLNVDGFSGSVILVSGEGARMIQAVRKLLEGSRVRVLGALEKPARRKALEALLKAWETPPPPPAAPRAAYARSELQAAVQAGQWLLHYQPKVEVQSGRLAGVEALLRWNHPRDGEVPPERFIAQAEECGLIDTMTDWVFGAALQQVARWRTSGLGAPVSINVSMSSLASQDFAQRLCERVRGSGLSENDITLEVSERRLMSPARVPLENLIRLRLRRFGLAIDDFGTGHSSLAQLRDVPFTELKIDQGFVHGARSNPVIRPILDCGVGLAKRLGMVSVAEGVQTEEDWQLVREVGCEQAQGWFIGPPMPGEQLVVWQAHWQSRLRVRKAS
jgi:EAL domain-containing protein (putative c-di-GMP-specific phosphodiesterase class I)/FixJ family two-component response regulator